MKNCIRHVSPVCMRSQADAQKHNSLPSHVSSAFWHLEALARQARSQPDVQVCKTWELQEEESFSSLSVM